MLAGLLIGVAAGGARAEAYRLQPGDVVEMAVAGVPDLRARAPIQIDGTLSLPLVGVLEAGGTTLSETRDRIQSELASQLLVFYLPDGSEMTRTVERDQISASVVEYRPVFVSGDVVRPGELTYRPGMTARQAIAAAGGLAPLAPIAVGSDPIRLRAEYGAAWHAAAAASARAWRLRTQLGDNIEFERAGWPPAPGQGETLEDILDLERRIAELAASNDARERDFQARQISQIDGQIAVLRDQLEVEKEGEEADAEALARAIEASEKGIYTQARLHDMRTAALISSTRRLQTMVDLMQIERRQTEVRRELQRMDERRRAELLEQLQQARAVEAREKSRLSAAHEQLSAAGLAPAPAADVGAPEITIIRRGVVQSTAATYDVGIEPGDVVEARRRSAAEPIGDVQAASQM